MNYRNIIYIFLGIGIFFPLSVFANFTFYVDPSYDLYRRDKIEAEYVNEVGNVTFFIDKGYYEDSSDRGIQETREILYNLGEEFRDNIYLNLTTLFGNEPVRLDGKINVLFHQMDNAFGGYFNPGDQYSRHQNPKSNEKNIVYLNVFNIRSRHLPAYLAHEFTHLITFNQKEIRSGITEEIWLNELRAEYAPTYLGYDDEYRRSNLESRVNLFLRDINVSLTEWTGRGADYGSINLFAQYIVDHYGVEILRDSLRAPKVGIESINYALEKNGFDEEFSDIFTNWGIALFLNDCNIGEKFCYNNEHLKDLKIMPQITYIPQINSFRRIISSSIKEWSFNWQMITGGKGKIILRYQGEEGLNQKVPYILCRNDSDCSVDLLSLNEDKEGIIEIDNFEDFNLTIIPSIQNKIEGFNGEGERYSFTFELLSEEEKTIEELLEKIRILEKEVERLLSLLENNCHIENNLYFGIRNSSEVRCLQTFLRNKGFYPEGIISGNFLNLTRDAVIRFQERYASEVLFPIGLNSGTGYVGEMTRKKMGEIKSF